MNQTRLHLTAISTLFSGRERGQHRLQRFVTSKGHRAASPIRALLFSDFRPCFPLVPLVFARPDRWSQGQPADRLAATATPPAPAPAPAPAPTPTPAPLPAPTPAAASSPTPAAAPAATPASTPPPSAPTPAPTPTPTLTPVAATVAPPSTVTAGLPAAAGVAMAVDAPANGDGAMSPEEASKRRKM